MFLVNKAKVKVELFDQKLHQWSPPQDHFLLDVFVACPRLLALGEAIPKLWSVPGSDKCKTNLLSASCPVFKKLTFSPTFLVSLCFHTRQVYTDSNVSFEEWC